jgi:hypothetical protein
MFWRPRSLRLRYTLRALLVFITLFMLWGGYHTNRSWKERAAEDVLKARGASFEYATHSFDGTLSEKAAAAYAMLIETVWQDRSIRSVRLLAPLDAEVVGALCVLTQLKSLTTCPSERTSEAYARVLSGKALSPTESMPNGALERIQRSCPLQQLIIGSWVLSDGDCLAIASCPTITHLEISGSRVSEQGLARLICKPGLRWFSFEFCDVTGSGLAKQPGSPTLERLYCGVAPVSNALAAFVSRSQNIKELAVRNCASSDNFVRALGPHPNLQELSLGSTKVTDDALVQIERMPALIYVGLPGATVSTESVARLQQARPRLRIDHH